jgi:hypothetical protein
MQCSGTRLNQLIFGVFYLIGYLIGYLIAAKIIAANSCTIEALRPASATRGNWNGTRSIAIAVRPLSHS